MWNVSKLNLESTLIFYYHKAGVWDFQFKEETLFGTAYPTWQ